MKRNRLFKEGNTASAVRNSTFSLISLATRFVGNMLIFIVIARLPGIQPTDFGQMTYASALAGLFVLISQFGLLPLLVRDVAGNSTLLNVYARSVFALRLILSAVGFFLIVLYVHWVGLGERARLVCYIMSLALYVGSFSTDLQALFQSREKMHLELFGIVVENMILLVSALLAFFFHPDIVIVSSIFLIAKTAALLLNYVICGKFLLWVYPVFDASLWRNLLLRALPFALTALLAAGVVQLDTILLRELAPQDPERAVGMYQAAIRLFMIPMFLPEIVLKVFLPLLSRMHGNAGQGLVRDLGRVNHVLVTLGVLVGVVILFRGGDIVRLIYGARYEEAGPLFQILGVTVMMRFSAAYNLYYTIRGKVWLRVISALVAVVAVFVFNWILIPRLGATGAACASVLANAVYLIPYVGFIFRAEGTVTLGWRYVQATFAAVSLAGILWLTSGIDLIYVLPGYAILCGLLVLVTMQSEDRERILEQFVRKGRRT